MNKKYKIFLTAILFFILFGVADNSRAATCEAQAGSYCFYASPDGSGDGSFESPCNVEAGLNKLGAGDILYLLDGVYSHAYTPPYSRPAIISINKYFNFLSPATVDRPITIKAYPGAAPILEGDGTNTGIWIDGEDNLVIEGLILRNFLEAGMRIGYDVVTRRIIVRGCDFSGVRCDDNMGGYLSE